MMRGGFNKEVITYPFLARIKNCTVVLAARAAVSQVISKLLV